MKKIIISFSAIVFILLAFLPSNNTSKLMDIDLESLVTLNSAHAEEGCSTVKYFYTNRTSSVYLCFTNDGMVCGWGTDCIIDPNDSGAYCQSSDCYYE